MEELKLQQKWEDMAVYAYQAVRMYPKSERHTLAADTTRSVIELGTGIARANVTRNAEVRRRIIAEADAELARLKTLVRLAVRLEFLTIKKYELLSVLLVEIGKMLGGWSKSA